MLPECRCLIGASLKLSRLGFFWTAAPTWRERTVRARCSTAGAAGECHAATPLDNCASFDPETLELLTRAFDEAWPSLAGRCHGYLNMQLKRDALASIIVKLAQNGERDVETLKTTALQAFAQIERPWGR